MNNIKGLYRHFKGQYYFVFDVCKLCCSNPNIEGDLMIYYFNVCHPEYGTFTRPLEESKSITDKEGVPIIDRKDNVTGNYHVFEKVENLDFQLGSVSTQSLVKELSGRKDNPYAELDIEGLNDSVFVTDYCLGRKHNSKIALDGTHYPKGVEPLITFTDKDDLNKYVDTRTHSMNQSVGKFKRTYLEIQ